MKKRLMVGRRHCLDGGKQSRRHRDRDRYAVLVVREVDHVIAAIKARVTGAKLGGVGPTNGKVERDFQHKTRQRLRINKH